MTIQSRTFSLKIKLYRKYWKDKVSNRILGEFCDDTEQDVFSQNKIKTKINCFLERYLILFFTKDGVQNYEHTCKRSKETMSIKLTFIEELRYSS